MSKAIVTYFSASGVTAKAAKQLAEALGCGVYEIAPKVPYTGEDLNWMNSKSRSSLEMKGGADYPELADTAADFSAYDTVFVGFRRNCRGQAAQRHERRRDKGLGG